MTFVNLKTMLPIRAIIWTMIFTSCFFTYMLRVNLSIIILEMVEKSEAERNGDNAACTLSNIEQNNVDMNEKMLQNLTDNLNESASDITKNNTTLNQNSSVVILNRTQNLINKLNFSDLNGDIDGTIRNIKSETTKFNWDSTTQGHILGAYFWGFFIFSIPGGTLSERFGARKCISASFLVSVILTLLAPAAASVSPYLLMSTRFFIGIAGAFVYPSLHTLVSKWAPPSEKGKFVSAMLGSSLGTVFSWTFLGKVMESLAWNWGFYICGILGLVWTILWIFLVSDTPDEHPWISLEEKEYINDSLKGALSKKKCTPPYKSMLFSLPCWAFTISHFGNLWGLFFLMTNGPMYLSSVLGFKIGKTGFLAALPYLARMFLGFFFGVVGDFVLKKEFMSKNTIRKSFTIFSHILPGLLLVAETLVGCQVTFAVTLIILSLASNGASTITNLQNAQDLAPNFAGSLYAVANCIASTAGFINPQIVAYITSDRNGIEEWHTIFYIVASVYMACGIVFMIFGTAEVQSWNFQNSEAEKATVMNDIQVKEAPLSGIDNKAFDEKN